MTSGIQSKGTDLDSIFSPYAAGTTQQRATGILVAGVDINARYANIIYGTAPAATGIKSEGTDLNALFCTGANYALPINGKSYNALRVIQPGTTAASNINFSITGSAGAWIYNVNGSTSTGGTETFASGPCPSAATSVMYTWGSYTIDTEDSLGSTTNSAASKTPISTGIAASYTTGVFDDGTGTRGRIYNFTITLYNAAGVAISTTNITLEASVDGSV